MAWGRERRGWKDVGVTFPADNPADDFLALPRRNGQSRRVA
jgi:hypothetical protein